MTGERPSLAPGQAPQVRCEQLFPTQVLICSWPQSAEHAPELRDAIMARRSAEPESPLTSLGWHSDTDMVNWGGDSARTLCDLVSRRADEATYDPLQQGSAIRFNWSIEMWAEVTDKLGSTQVHSHPGAWLTALYFVDDGYDGSADAGLGGELVFLDPRYPMVRMRTPDLATASMFETPLLIDTVPDFAALNTELAAAIRALREQDPAGTARSPRYGWRSDVSGLGWGGPAAQTLVQRAFAVADAHSIDLRQSATAARYHWYGVGWANILDRGASMPLHTHPAAFWSAIYYVDDGYDGAADSGLGGELEIEDPRMPMVMAEEPDLRFRPRPDGPVLQHELSIRPVTGSLLMFPGWLRHGVRPYEGGGQRISIAINLTATGAAQ